MASPDDVSRFWFGSADPLASPSREVAARWYAGGPAFDAEVRGRFGSLLDDPDEVAGWDGPAGLLAAIVALDQLPRNAFRGTARAFFYDARALSLARRVVDEELDRALGPWQRGFAYLPFQHAEDRAAQDRSVVLYERLAAEHPETATNLDFARLHRDIVARFGRVPGRNLALSRPDTAEELAWLAAGGETFGARPR